MIIEGQKRERTLYMSLQHLLPLSAETHCKNGHYFLVLFIAYWHPAVDDVDHLIVNLQAC